MIKVFTEYKVKRDLREEFLSLHGELREYHQREWKVKDFHLFEGTDQPDLFVEEFHVQHFDLYEQIKAERRSEKSDLWKKMHQCIEGGVQKVHIWAFQEVR